MRGGRRERAGRPAPLGARTERLALRLTPEERGAIELAAEASDMAPSEFVREVVRMWLTDSRTGGVL